MSLKQLLIGDLHVVPEELDECERVADLIEEVVAAEDPDHVVFLGDEYNHHAQVHVRVQEFWLRRLDRLNSLPGWIKKPSRQLIVIKGNHDMDPTHGVTAHALMAHKHQATIVDKDMVIDGILFLPYTVDPEQFYSWVQTAWTTVSNLEKTLQIQGVICHQTFNGCKYENGFYAKDGFDLEKVHQPWVISGHIHAPQRFNKLWYPGAPRWRSTSDANTERGIYVIQHKDGSYIGKRIDTAPRCRVIHQVNVTPDSPTVPPLAEKDLGIVDVTGPTEFVDAQVLPLKAAGWRVRSHPTEAATILVKESEGIAQSFHKFLDVYTPKYNTPKETLTKLARERLSV